MSYKSFAYDTSLIEEKEEVVIPKCLVRFRPHGNYNGEYGFDWMRAGDTGLKGDDWFGNIMGKHYEPDGTTVLQDSNSYNGIFKKDLKMYNKKLQTFKNLRVSWKSSEGKPYLYPCPRMTLMPQKKAILTLKLEIEELPQKQLSFCFKESGSHKSDYFLLSHSEIPKEQLKKGKFELSNYLTITNLKDSPRKQTLEVRADDELCGQLIIHPNDGKTRKNIKVVLVNVETLLNTVSKTGSPKAGGEFFFRHCLGQALITPTLEIADITCTKVTFRDSFATLRYGDYELDDAKLNWDFKTYLEDTLKDQHKSKYDDYYQLYFLDEDGDGSNGFSYSGTKFGVFFNTHELATFPHELFHAMGLSHTFDGVSSSSKYTYEGTTTDNIMDYSHHTNIPRRSLFKWQWQILNGKIK